MTREMISLLENLITPKDQRIHDRYIFCKFEFFFCGRLDQFNKKSRAFQNQGRNKEEERFMAILQYQLLLHAKCDMKSPFSDMF